MKKRFKRKSKLLCCLIALIMVAESSMTTAVALGDEVAGLLETQSGSTATEDGGGGDSVLPDTGADEWYVPTAVTNPNQVDTTIRSYPVYNDEIYDKIDHYLQTYQQEVFVNTYGRKTYEHVTASLGVVTQVAGYNWLGKTPNYWDYNYFNGSITRRNGQPGIYQNILTPEFQMGTSLYGPKWIHVDVDDFDKFEYALNPDHLSLRFACRTSDSISYMELHGLYGTEERKRYPLSNGYNEIDIPHETLEWTSRIKIEVGDLRNKLTDISLAYVDNTSPSITNVDAYQKNGDLEVCITFNEAMRWAAPGVVNDLDDIWVDVELQVLGTNVTQTIRAHVSSVEQKGVGNQVYFRGDLGAFENLDYKILAIKDVNLPQKDYPITFGVLWMCAIQKGRTNYNSVYTVSDVTDYKNGQWVPRTTNTSAICDAAGNALHLETAVNWPINQKEIKNGKTFVRKIEMLNDKTLLGLNKIEADGFNNSIGWADFFFGNGDEITPRLYLSQTLSEEELATFRIRLNVKDSEGNYIWLTPKSTGRYYLKGEILCEADKEYGGEEFMYVDFEPVTLKQGMTPVMEDGSALPYLMVDEVEATCDPPLVTQIPDPETTLYIDLLPPAIEVSPPTEFPMLNSDNYYPLTIPISISDATIEGKRFSGVLEQLAHVYLSADVNDKTPFKFIVNTNAVPPATPDEYLGSGTLAADQKICLTEGRPVGMTADTNTVYAHLLIPQKENLLMEAVHVYVDISDTVKNTTDPTEAWSFGCYIDHQNPDVSVTSSRVTYGADFAIAEVGVAVSDYNKVESIRYQWVENGELPTENGWQAVQFTAGTDVLATISSQYDATETVKYDMRLFVKAVDEKGNESPAIEYTVLIDIEKPGTVYEVGSDLSAPSGQPQITVTGPAPAQDGRDAYTRVTVAPLNPAGNWMYMTVVKSGSELNLFDPQNGAEWYKVHMSGDFITAADKVDGETVTLDDLKNYYGNVKISFESAYMDLTPEIGYKNDFVTDGSYVASQNILTARFASQNAGLEGVNSIGFGRVVDREGNQLTAVSGEGTPTIVFTSAERGVNTMRGTTLYFNVTNRKMVDWGALDIDFANSKIELLQTTTGVKEDAVVICTQQGLAHSTEQSFTIPAYLENGEWFTTGLYFLRVTVHSLSGGIDTADSMNFVFDASEVTADGLISYSFDLPYDPEGSPYRNGGTAAENETLDSFGIALQPTVEAMRNNVFAVYTGGVRGFSFTIGATPDIRQMDGISVGEVEGFRYWNSLSAPSAEDLEGLAFTKTSRNADSPGLTVTSGVESIYTKDTIPKGADGLGDIYLVEGVNTICYQTKMTSGYVTPVKQFTIIVTQYVPEFNVAVHDYTPSHEYAQRDGQVNAHDITMIVEEAFSLNGSGNVRVEMWSSYALEVNGELVEEQGDNVYVASLALLTDELKAGDLITLNQDSYTSCYPPYSGQGNYCTAAFMAVDEYGGSVVYAPQIGALDRVNDSGDAYDDLYSIGYYGDLQDDPFVIGHDASFITIYNEEVYYGAELVGFQNLVSRNWGDYEPVEFSIPELKYNLFAIDTNDVKFGGYSDVYAGDRAYNGVVWDSTRITNYDLIDWNQTKISVYDADGTTVLLENADLFAPGASPSGFMGATYGEVYYPDNGEYRTHFSLYFANPEATADHPVYDSSTMDFGTPEYDASHRCLIFKIEGVNIYGDPFVVDGSVDTEYISYDGLDDIWTSKGIQLELPYVTVEHKQTIITEQFVKGGTFSAEVTDMFGEKRTVTHTFTEGIDADVQISFSTFRPSAEAVVIRLTSDTVDKIYVDITDPGRMSVTGNGTADVTVTVTDNVKFSFQYTKDQTVKSVMLEVDYILKPNPRVDSTNLPTSSLRDPDTGVTYMYGTVTVDLRDDNFTLLDRYTGKTPTYTFLPGGPTVYTFQKDDIVAYFNGDDGQTEYEIPRDVVVSLGVDELREPIDAMEQLKTSSPAGLKIKAYKNNNGFYEDIKSSLVIESYQMSDAFDTEEGERRYAFSGYSVSAESLLKDLGWGTAFRFVTEYTASVNAKSFIKQGIYPGAPDYETGMSDQVEGVTLNGRLLTVEKNAQFTLYMVAKDGGHVAVAFDVDSIGTAPIPEVVKVPVSNALVRAYVVFPDDENLTNPTITPADTGYEVKYESEGEYAGIPYVEYTANNDYLINYTFDYNGTPVQGTSSVSVCEIKIREMHRLGTIEWSANKTQEATGSTVSATLKFSEIVTGFEVTAGELNSDVLTIETSGSQVTFSYVDNHDPITVRFDSAYGSVVADIEAVTNIDRAAPEITEVSRTLSNDGRTLTIVLAASERVVFREGGYVGEQYEGDPLYYFTRKLTANQSYTYHFVDMAGLETEYVVEVSEIVDQPLRLFFSFTGTMDDAVTDPADLELNAGDTIYVSPSRDVSISVNDEAAVDLPYGAWLEVELSDDLGGMAPFVAATDVYGNTLVTQFSQIIPKDASAPTVTVVNPVISVAIGSDRAEVQQILLNNIYAVDQDPNLTYTVSFTEDLSVSGIFEVIYTVADSAGNQTEARGKLRVLSASEPIIHINGTQINRDSSYFTESDVNLSLTVDVDGQPYCAYMESGIKTVAQMKITHTELTDYYVTDTEVEIGTLESGFYTVIIQTQSRDYFRIIIYVY